MPDEALIKQKKKLTAQQEKINLEIRKIVNEPENIVPFLVPGRLIRVEIKSDNKPAQDWGWGILVSFTKQRINPKNFNKIGKTHRELVAAAEKNESHYVLDIYLYVKDRLSSENTCQPGDTKTKDGRIGIVPVILCANTIADISTIQVNLPHNHKQAEKSIEMMYFEILKRFESKEIPTLHPIDDLDIENKVLFQLLDTKSSIKK